MISFREGRYPGKVADGWQRGGAVVADAREQLGEYFAGRRRLFDLPLAPSGTAFQLRACGRRFRTYPTAPPAPTASRRGPWDSHGRSAPWGRPTGATRSPSSFPCHRVIGGDGRLTGYAGGLDIKKFLIELERRHVNAAEWTARSPGGLRPVVVRDLYSRETAQREQSHET
ncbi:Methylated-DNA--protein-cysteine methyltransferase [Geodia barretti]|uniref:Methylated-DNA--protein-cysteine methyltransferase n=1 Tax=Geodia barretti TaxID=519541 RepID=A0AA35T7J6_GEOBA|nr:Methylated-DNA--protein-cysteine methyltransferase [Geodia barretti]